MKRVAVITPYYNEELELIMKCHESVENQTHPCLHVLVADGKPYTEINKWNADHIILPASHNDIGSTPRLIGAYHSIGLDYDIVTFLDADNWYHSKHVERIVSAANNDDPGFITTGRILCRLDGSIMSPCPFTNPKRFIDTNCMAFTRKGYNLLHNWALMPSYGHLIGDRIMLYHVKRSGIKHTHISESSAYYRCKREGIYKHFKEQIPAGVLPSPNYKLSYQKWIDDGNDPLNA